MNSLICHSGISRYPNYFYFVKLFVSLVLVTVAVTGIFDTVTHFYKIIALNLPKASLLPKFHICMPLKGGGG